MLSVNTYTFLVNICTNWSSKQNTLHISCEDKPMQCNVGHPDVHIRVPPRLHLPTGAYVVTPSGSNTLKTYTQHNQSWIRLQYATQWVAVSYTNLDPMHYAVKWWSTSTECATVCHSVPLCTTLCQTQVFLEDFSAPGGGGGSLGAKNTNALTIMLRFHVFTIHKLHFTFCNTLHKLVLISWVLW